MVEPTMPPSTAGSAPWAWSQLATAAAKRPAQSGTEAPSPSPRASTVPAVSQRYSRKRLVPQSPAMKAALVILSPLGVFYKGTSIPSASSQGMVFIGTAGWSIPTKYAAAFPNTGSHLDRYGTRLKAVEINSSFYRPHQRTTYERWAASVPADFRFSVKLPRSITPNQRLTDCDDLLARFVEESAGLGAKLGVILVQLPPSLAYDTK